MNKQTIGMIIFLGLAIIGFSWGAMAQNNANKQVQDLEKILELDREALKIDEEISYHQEMYHVSMDSAVECSESFIANAEQHHIDADKARVKKAELEKEKWGLIKSRQAQ